MDKSLLDYFNSFINKGDYPLFLKVYDQKHDFDDTNINDPEYIQLVNFYNRLLNIKGYRVEVDEHCTSLIKKLFQRYVNKDTFVLTTEQEHPAVKNYLPENNTYIICVNELNRKDAIPQIIQKFKQSGCKNFFLIMAGVVPGSSEILSEAFFRQLKLELTRNNINHIFTLDDCQGLYMINRDYSDFDCILGTAHVVVRYGFSMGILYTKLPHIIGHINKGSLKDFTSKLNYAFNHKQDALKFNSLMTEFLKDEIDNDTFTIKGNQASHMLTISTNGVKFNQKNATYLKDFGIIFSELNSKNRLIRLRYQDTLLFEPQELIKGLYQFKKMLHSLKKMKELGTDLTFDNSVDIDYGFMVNGTNKSIGDVNKKIYKSSFRNNEVSEIINRSSLMMENQKSIVYNYIFSHQR